MKRATILSWLRARPACCLLLAIVLAFACTLTPAFAESAEANPDESAAAAAAPLPDDATLLKMRVRQLKEFLVRKGPDAECKACTSKQEYVDRIRETATWPDVTPEPESEPAAGGAGDKDVPSPEELQELFKNSQNDKLLRDLKEKMTKSGADTSKIFGDGSGSINAEELVKYLKLNAGKDGGAAPSGAEAAAGVDAASAEANVDAKADL